MVRKKEAVITHRRALDSRKRDGTHTCGLRIILAGEVVKFLGKKTYQMRGYAYSGGGHKVTRVEVSFDQVSPQTLNPKP